MNDITTSTDQDWLKYLRVQNYSPATVTVREESLAKLRRYLDGIGVVSFREVTGKHLEAWRRKMFVRGLKPATIEQRLRTAKLFFNYIEERRLIFENPARKFRPHRIAKALPRVPTPEQVKLIIEAPAPNTAVGIRDRALLEVMYCAGLRLGEAAAMKTIDLDFSQATLLVHGKGARERVLPLGHICRRSLRDYLNCARPVLLKSNRDDGWLWISQRGQPLSRQGVMIRVTGHIRAVGLERFSSHALRRAAATHMLANGAGPIAVQEFLGHASLKHLSCYLKVTMGELKAMHERSLPGS